VRCVRPPHAHGCARSAACGVRRRTHAHLRLLLHRTQPCSHRRPEAAACARGWRHTHRTAMRKFHSESWGEPKGFCRLESRTKARALVLEMFSGWANPPSLSRPVGWSRSAALGAALGGDGNRFLKGNIRSGRTVRSPAVLRRIHAWNQRRAVGAWWRHGMVMRGERIVRQAGGERRRRGGGCGGRSSSSSSSSSGARVVHERGRGRVARSGGRPRLLRPPRSHTLRYCASVVPASYVIQANSRTHHFYSLGSQQPLLSPSRSPLHQAT
jgi:hypothetical protein